MRPLKHRCPVVEPQRRRQWLSDKGPPWDREKSDEIGHLTQRFLENQLHRTSNPQIVYPTPGGAL
jgi:hypothetical protein